MKPFWSIEPVLRRLRMGPTLPYITPGGIMVDIGCDEPPLTINYFKDEMEHCFGLDADVEDREYENVTIKQAFLRKKIPLPDELAHVVTMLAVLEHMEFPQAIANELYRIVKTGRRGFNHRPLTPKQAPA
jgi:ubiquinone/menaquinone biosynthesis C-methylase UbiE